MIYGLWQSAAGLQAQQYRQALIANNLANAETPGFKPDRIAFRERLNAAMGGGALRARHPVLDAMTGGLFEMPVHTDFAFDRSKLIPSTGPLDVAVEGAGFLVVQTAEGPHFTRDGRLAMDRDGILVHVASGGAVLDTRGRSITLDPTAGGRIKIDASGNIRQGAEVAGQLALVDFTDRQQLEKVGHNLFAAGFARSVPAEGNIRQFYSEASGVVPVEALVEMIAATRAHDINARMISLQDESLARLVNDVGRIG